MIINIEDEEEMEWGNLKDEEEIIDNINENEELIWRIDELDFNFNDMIDTLNRDVIWRINLENWWSRFILWQMKKNWIEKECRIFILLYFILC